jgi:ribosomal protein S18 acetylase RimI-like enzyme
MISREGEGVGRSRTGPTYRRHGVALEEELRKGYSTSMPHDPSSEIRIAPIGEEHIESFYRCLDDIAKERRYLGMIEAPPIASTTEFIRSNIARNAIQLVALFGETVVGWCDIAPHDWTGFRHSGRLGMGVHAEFRRRGIGKRLAVQAIAAAHQRGLERVELDVYVSNRAALALYEKLGFVHEGLKKNARKLDGVYDDLLIMALFLDTAAPSVPS